MKLLSILLFLFELLAPALYASVSDKAIGKENDEVTLTASAHTNGLMTLAFFEESTSEGEREGKGQDEALCFLDVHQSIELFNSLKKFEPVNTQFTLPKERFDTHPPLFTLHCVLTI